MECANGMKWNGMEWNGMRERKRKRKCGGMECANGSGSGMECANGSVAIIIYVIFIRIKYSYEYELKTCSRNHCDSSPIVCHF